MAFDMSVKSNFQANSLMSAIINQVFFLRTISIFWLEKSIHA